MRCSWFFKVISFIISIVIYNPCCEFRWSPEGPVSQIHSPHFHVGAPGIFSNLLRSVHMAKRDWVRKETGSYRTYSVPGKTAALVPEFAVKDLPSAELQSRFQRLQWRTCPWAEHCDEDKSQRNKDVSIKKKCVLKTARPKCKLL